MTHPNHSPVQKQVGVATVFGGPVFLRFSPPERRAAVKLSVIMPVFQRGKRTILSVIDQGAQNAGVPDIELVVVNDCLAGRHGAVAGHPARPRRNSGGHPIHHTRQPGQGRGHSNGPVAG